jgi:hypothetical protein
VGSRKKIGVFTKPVGQLAGEEALTVSIDVGCSAAFAGKPAPTGVDVCSLGGLIVALRIICDK